MCMSFFIYDKKNVHNVHEIFMIKNIYRYTVDSSVSGIERNYFAFFDSNSIITLHLAIASRDMLLGFILLLFSNCSRAVSYSFSENRTSPLRKTKSSIAQFRLSASWIMFKAVAYFSRWKYARDIARRTSGCAGVSWDS